MQRYFLKEAYTEIDSANIPIMDEDYHHIVNVMRMSVGNQCYLVFSDKQAIIGEIVEITDRQVSIKEVAKEQQDKEFSFDVSIACGYPKGDKLDLVVQKGTELGAHHFVGFPAQTSVVKWDGKKLAKKQSRLEKIAKEAAEQSHRQIQPSITLIEDKQVFLASLKEYTHILVAYEEAAKQGEKAGLVETLETIQDGEKVLIIFGPEGGITPKEVADFQELGGKICGLGPRILRAETAPFYVLSAISYHRELLQK